VQHQPALVHWRFCEKKLSIPEKFRCAFGVCVLHVRRPNYAPILKKGRLDVVSLVFVSADNINVSALLTTDLFIKNWVGQLLAAEPKAAYPSKKIPTV